MSIPLYTNKDNSFYQETLRAVQGKFGFSISSETTDTFMCIRITIICEICWIIQRRA